MTNKYKGFTLQSAIFVLLFTSIILGLLLSLLKINLNILNSSEINSILISDIKSAENIALAIDASEASDSINFNGDFYINYKTNYWGLFNYIHVYGRYKNIEKHVKTLSSHCLRPETLPTIRIKDSRKHLSISGNTFIEGDVYCPNATVDRAYIEGNSYNNKKLVYGNIFETDKLKIDFNLSQLKNRIAYLKKKSSESKYKLFYSEVYTDSLTNSFDEETLILEFKNQAFIDGVFLSGNIIIKSNKTINISNTAHISDCVLMAPKIVIKSGFEGNLQAIVSDSLIIEENVRIKQPSNLILYKNTNYEDVNLLSISGESIIEANIYAYIEGYRKHKNVINIGENTEVKGIIFSNNLIQLKGKVEGSVICHGFYLKTPSSVYKNTLLDVELYKYSDNKWLPSTLVNSDKGTYVKLKRVL